MKEQQISKAALVGTRRSPLSPRAREELAGWGIPADRPDEEAVLSAAAIISQSQKAQYCPKEWPASEEAAPTSTEQVCPPRSIKHLYMIVDGAFEHALPEFLYHLSQHNKCLPPEILPDLLNQSLASPDLWARLRPSIGQRGHWLIGQNPAWARLATPAAELGWAEAGNKKRVVLLQKERRENPSHALQLARKAWPKESLPQRIQFMQALAVVKDGELEAFLEELLDDRRKEIRRAAVQILAQIPNAQLCQRTFARLKGLITIKEREGKKNKLDIQLPDKLDDAMIRDGVDPRVQWFKGGVKASRLGQMVSLTPPRMWQEYMALDAKGVLDMFVRSDWGELLVQAMVEATHLHQDPEWAEALLLFRIESQHRQRWQRLNVSRLMEDLPDEVFNRVATQGMEATEGLLEEDSPVTQLLKSGAALWEDGLTILVMKNLQEWLAGETSRYWNGWHYRSILKKAAYTCNPFLHDKLRADWPEDSRIWASWERDIEEFLSTLFFRKKMIRELGRGSGGEAD